MGMTEDQVTNAIDWGRWAFWIKYFLLVNNSKRHQKERKKEGTRFENAMSL